MGKGDRRTKRGKIWRGTYGKSRIRKRKSTQPTVANPAKTLKAPPKAAKAPPKAATKAPKTIVKKTKKEKKE